MALTFRELFEKLDTQLIPSNKYYSAHRRNDDLELLEAHSKLCTNYFLYIIDELELEFIFEDFISNIFQIKQLEKIKEILLYAIYYHDIGKINPNFQSVKVHKKTSPRSLNTKHSFFSTRVLISFLLKKYPDFKNVIYIISDIVSNHHTRLNDYTIYEYNESREERKIINKILSVTNTLDIELNSDEKKSFYKNISSWGKMFLFVKLFYSLLVLSDSYSTIHFTHSLDKMLPMHTIDIDIKDKMIQSYARISYNANIECNINENLRDVKDINNLRREMLVESNREMKKLLLDNKKIFMLSIPTGGGKTNISMKLALNVLEHDEKIKRIFYVFPYINIIEQNYDAIDKTLFNESLFLHTKRNIISDIYSRGFVDKNTNDDSQLDEMMLLRDDNFLNNCVNVITSVNFFESIIKNGGNNRYKIANLCNSVVIIDEIQTISDNNLRIFYDFINETSKNLNIYYIIMSATLPDLNYFIEGETQISQIIRDYKKYFEHPIFKRNEIIFKRDIESIEDIKRLVLEEIENNYLKGMVRVLITLNTVNTSIKVYDDLSNDVALTDFSFYLLNSTTPNLRRKKIIEEIKNKKYERIIIVSTQSIEAGVDIDCDFGIRDFCILDSIEQVSGRINRECDFLKSKNSKLFVINYKDEESKLSDSEKIYGSQERYKIMIDEFNHNDLECILKKKEFDKYYKTLSKNLKEIAKDSFDLIHTEIRKLHYQSINKELRVIDTKLDKIDIFICDEIPICDLTEYDYKKIEKLIKNDAIIWELMNEYKIIHENKILTLNIYRIWKHILSSTDKFKDAYLRKKITSLYNQFVISINNIKQDNIKQEETQDLREYLEMGEFIKCDEKFDSIISTEKFLEFYSFKDGVRIDKLKIAMNDISDFVII